MNNIYNKKNWQIDKCNLRKLDLISVELFNKNDLNKNSKINYTYTRLILRGDVN